MSRAGAIDAAHDELASALLERAVKGVPKPLLYGGQTITTVQQYSDGLAMFILKARRPEIYGRVNLTPDAPGDPVTERAALDRQLASVAAQLARQADTGE